MAVLRRSGFERATLEEVLAECGLGTRAFYRHFSSKDDLLITLYRREAEASVRRITRRVTMAETPLGKLEVWIDDLLSIGFDGRRASRARVLWSIGARSATGYDSENARSTAALIEPLVSVLEEGQDRGVFPDADPAADAATISAIAWDVIAALRLQPSRFDAERARAHVLRFDLGAVGYRR